MLKKLLNAARRMVTPVQINEDLARREFILNILLIASITLISIAAAVHIVGDIVHFLDQDMHENNVLPLRVLLIILLFFTILYTMSRKGFARLASYILLGIFFLFATQMGYAWGVELPAELLFYALIIVMSGILINTRFAFLSALLISSTIALINRLQTVGLAKTNIYWRSRMWQSTDVAMAAIIFCIIATVSWLSNREIEKSLARARKSESELKEERDSLEIRVEERTKELQKAQMEKMTEIYRMAEFGRLSGGLFHDLVNPLTAVSLNIEKIKEDGCRGGELKTIIADLDRAKNATSRMQEFINSVRKQLAHQETNEMFSLNQEMKECMQIMTYHARKNAVEIELKTEQEIQMNGNPFKFSQIVTNLVSNAIESYAPIESAGAGRENVKRTVEVSMERKGDVSCLTVRDNGCGIPEHIKDKIFEPFFTTKDFKRGIGIGLSFIKHIVEDDFGGKIVVESDKDNGTKFTVRIPIR